MASSPAADSSPTIAPQRPTPMAEPNAPGSLARQSSTSWSSASGSGTFATLLGRGGSPIGVNELIARNCRQAARFAEGLRAAGYSVLNEVVINQVLVSFGDADTTRRVVDAIQAEGTCWAGATLWQGQTAMRISVSSWATTDDDVERCLAAIIRTAAAVHFGSRHDSLRGLPGPGALPGDHSASSDGAPWPSQL